MRNIPSNKSKMDNEKNERLLLEEYCRWASTSLDLTIHSNLQIQDLNDEERGVFFSGLSTGSIAVSVPYTAILTVDSWGDLLKTNLMVDLREEDTLAILLLFEKYIIGESSKWSQHIELLPKKYYSISTFSAQELKLIQGSNLYLIASKWQRQIREDFELLNLKLRETIALSSNHPLLPLLDGNYLTFENYHWALCTIWSRFISVLKCNNFAGEKVYRKGMVPVVDMCNHSPLSKTSHVYNQNYDRLELIYGDDSDMNSILTQPSQLFINYGNISNYRAMMLYGFAMMNNVHDIVHIYGSMERSDPFFNIKLKILQFNDIFTGEDFEPFEITMSSELPQKLMVFLRVQQAGLEEFLNLELSNEDFSTYAKKYTQMISSEIEDNIVSLLISTFENMLDNYPDTIEDDEMLLKQWNLLEETASNIQSLNKLSNDLKENEPSSSKCGQFIPPSEKEKNAVILRYGEKKILQHNIFLLSDYKNRIFSSYEV